MFGRKKEKKILEKIYNIQNLYVAAIGVVEPLAHDNNKFIIRKDLVARNLVIVKVGYHIGKNYKYGTSIINGVTYDYFHDSYNSLDRYIGQAMIFREVPLVNFLPLDKTFLTLDEIIELEEEYNEDDEEPKEEDAKIQDVVLEEIKNLADKAKLIIDEEDKTSILDKISKLAEYYVNELIKIKSNADSSLTLTDSETDLIKECIAQVYDLSSLINKALSNNDTLKDYMILKRSLGSE